MQNFFLISFAIFVICISIHDFRVFNLLCLPSDWLYTDWLRDCPCCQLFELYTRHKTRLFWFLWRPPTRTCPQNCRPIEFVVVSYFSHFPVYFIIIFFILCILCGHTKNVNKICSSNMAVLSRYAQPSLSHYASKNAESVQRRERSTTNVLQSAATAATVRASVRVCIMTHTQGHSNKPSEGRLRIRTNTTLSVCVQIEWRERESQVSMYSESQKNVNILLLF